MFKRLLALLSGSFFIANVINAQTNGILPLSGVRYFKEGINARSITVKIDGFTLLSNRIPLNKEVEISLQQISGFTETAAKWFAGAELSVFSPKGDLLMKNPNIFLKNEATGFAAAVKDMSVKFGITPEIIKSNFACTIKLRFFDLKGKNQLRLELPVTIARQGETVQVSKTAVAIKSPEGTVSMINGLKAKGMSVSIDTGIRVAPKMAYTSLEIADVDGSSIGGIFQGKESFWVYDQDLNEVRITDQLLKQVKGAMENSTVNYTLKIPYRLKTTLGKQYTVRFRWESPDKNQVIDVVTSK